MSKTVNSKEALMMLDTDIDQDMSDYKREVTLEAIKFINRNPELYTDVHFGKLGARSHNVNTVKKTCVDYAKAHKNEFGNLFQTELDMVDWEHVMRIV